MNLRLYELLRTLINIALSIITFFLITRVVLRFFSTNPQTPFVQWVFSISNSLISPFANIVPDINTPTGVLDIVTLVTLLAYLIIGYIVLSIIEGLTTPEIVEEEDSRVAHYHDIPYRRKYKYPQRKEDYDL
jgi:uncharacterized protein YggT (Ycf19 family)